MTTEATILAAHGLVPDRVCKTADDGNSAFCFLRRGLYADIELEASGEMLAVTSNRRDHPVVWVVRDLDETVQRIKDFISQGDEAEFGWSRQIDRMHESVRKFSE